MTPRAVAVDRAAAVRAALRSVVAEHGLYGASMARIAAEAGVATGTAYTHYSSKDDVLIAAYLESKRALAEAATDGVDPDLPPALRFQQLWLAAYRHLAADPAQARFLVQVASSPYARVAHDRAAGDDSDPLLSAATAPDMAGCLLPLPLEVLYDLGLGAAVRLAADGITLEPDDLATIAAACWRAITVSE